MLFRFPFYESCMQEVVSELEHTADMHKFFGIIVVNLLKKNSITD